VGAHFPRGQPTLLCWVPKRPCSVYGGEESWLVFACWLAATALNGRTPCGLALCGVSVWKARWAHTSLAGNQHCFVGCLNVRVRSTEAKSPGDPIAYWGIRIVLPDGHALRAPNGCVGVYAWLSSCCALVLCFGFMHTFGNLRIGSPPSVCPEHSTCVLRPWLRWDCATGFGHARPGLDLMSPEHVGPPTLSFFH